MMKFDKVAEVSELKERLLTEWYPKPGELYYNKEHKGILVICVSDLGMLYGLWLVNNEHKASSGRFKPIEEFKDKYQYISSGFFYYVNEYISLDS